MLHLVTVEVKGNAPGVNVAIREMSYTRHAFFLWNIIMIGERVYIGISTGNWKQRLYNHILSPIHNFRNRLLYLNIFETLQIRG